MQKEINFFTKRRSYSFMIEIEMPNIPLDAFEVKFINFSIFFKYFFTIAAIIIGVTTLRLVSPQKKQVFEKRKRSLKLLREHYFSDTEPESLEESEKVESSLRGSHHSEIEEEEIDSQANLERKDEEEEEIEKEKSPISLSGQLSDNESKGISNPSKASKESESLQEKRVDSELEFMEDKNFEENHTEKSKQSQKDEDSQENPDFQDLKDTTPIAKKKDSDDFEELAGCIREELNESNTELQTDTFKLSTKKEELDTEEEKSNELSPDFFKAEMNKTQGSQYYSLFGEAPSQQFEPDSFASMKRRKKISGDLADDEFSYYSDNSLSQNSFQSSSINTSIRNEQESSENRPQFSYLGGPRLPDFIGRKDYSGFYKANYSNFYSSFQRSPQGFGNSHSFTSNPLNFGRSETEKNYNEKGRVKPPPGFGNLSGISK